MAKNNPLAKPAKKDDAFHLEMPDISGARVPKSQYEAKLISVEKSTSKQNNPMWTWTFAIVGGKYAGEELLVWTAFTPAAMWKVAETLNALGLGGKPGEKITFTKKDAIGRLVILDVVEEEYEGRMSSKVNRVLPHPKGAGYKKTSGPSVIEDEDEEDLEDEEEEDIEETEEEEEENDEDDEDEEEDDDEDEEEDDDDDEDEDEDEEEDDEDEEDEDEEEDDEDEEDDDDDDEDEDEDDEEEEAPPPKKSKASPSAKKSAPPAKAAPAKKSAPVKGKKR